MSIGSRNACLDTFSKLARIDRLEGIKLLVNNLDSGEIESFFELLDDRLVNPTVQSSADIVEDLDPTELSNSKRKSYFKDLNKSDTKNIEFKQERRKSYRCRGQLNNAAKFKEKKQFSCGKCGESFSSVKDHLTHNERCKPLDVSDNTNIARKVHRGAKICQICGELISYKHMSRHINRVHAKTVKSICQICGESISASKMYRHMNRVHVKNFSCTYCNKMYGIALQAKLCEKKHTGIFKFSCHVCEYKTNCKWHLNRHTDTHQRIKSYSCPICRKKSSRKEGLKRHLEKVHKADESSISQLGEL